jgi:two-component system sensor histidine kinase/response regulator
MPQPDSRANRDPSAYLDLAFRLANLFPAVLDFETGEISPDAWDEVVGNPPGTTPPRLEAWEAAIHLDDRPARDASWADCLAGRAPLHQAEYRVRRHDGRWVWIKVVGKVVERESGGRPLQLALAVRNIDDLRQAEQQLRERERQLESLMGHLPGLAYRALADEHWTALFVSKGIEDLTGYPADEFTSRRLNYADIMLPEDRPATREAVFTALRERRMYEAEHRIRHKDGSVRWIWARGHGVFAPDGSLRFIEGLNLDMTRQKQAEEELRRTTELFQAVADGTQDAVYVKDREGRHLMVNAAASRLVGKPTNEVLGRDDTEIFDPDSAREVMAHDRRVMESGVAATKEHELSAGGVTRTYLSSKAPYRDGHGNVIGLIGICHDITERKRAEEALRQANARLDLAVRGSNLAIWECDMPDGCIENSHLTLANFWESLGYEARTSPTDFPSTFALLVHPDDQERVSREFDELFASDRQEHESEYRVRTKDGSTRWHLARGTVLRDPKGKPVRFIGTSADITELKRAEEALRESEQRWRSLTEALPQLVWSATPDGTCDYFSSQWTEHTGIAEADLLGWQWLETLHPDDREPTRRFWLESVAGHHAYDIEYRVRHKGGEYRWFKTRGVPIRDSGGNIVKWFGTCTDITELRDSEGRFRGTFENAAVGIGHRRFDGRFLRVNQKFCTILGYSRDELLQRTGPGITHPDDLAAGVDLAEALLRGELPGFTLEKRYVRRDGSPVWVDLSVSLQRDGAGKPDYFIGIVQDISNRKRLEEELRRAKEAAEAANRAKDEFLANVSHEIRTPMNAIIGMTELVLDTPLDEGQRQGLKTVKSAADSLLSIINDLLDFSKIEAGKLELVAADFLLRPAVGDTLRALAVRAHKKGLELIYQVDADVPDALIGDAGRLRQVLLNLVGNAVKFTDEGEVEVRVDVVGDDPPTPPPAGSVGLRFTVRDTGIGIPPDQQERIFRAFEQEDTSTTRRYGGTGLGLTIAARLVALMDGTITVDSAPGRGSTFTFTARFGRQPHPSEAVPALPPVSLHNLPVLVVDDNDTNRHILAQWLRDWQMDATAVSDGMAAVDALWHRAANGRPYSLVLLDARMPDADGLMVAAMIRERTEFAATRIILLTSGERPGDPGRYRELRIDAQLLKPVQQDELLETIYGVMSRTKSNAPLLATPASRQMASTALVPAATPLHILVAEDNELSAQVLEQLLVRQGDRVRLASSGREALTLAQQGSFDLLLLDVHMPELDGFQVVRAIRERESTAGGHLPIIALTARSRKEDRERCLAAGMDEFLTKPIRPADLLAAIDRVLSAHSSRQSRSWDLLDAPVLLAACGGDPTLLSKMCQTLITRIPAHLAALRDAQRNQDAPRLREAAHKCCGMVSEFSTVAGDLAGNLEDMAARAQLDKAAPVMEKLENTAHELVKQLHGITVEALRRQVRFAEERTGSAGS